MIFTFTELNFIATTAKLFIKNQTNPHFFDEELKIIEKFQNYILGTEAETYKLNEEELPF